jgi:hypothetical protein
MGTRQYQVIVRAETEEWCDNLGLLNKMLEEYCARYALNPIAVLTGAMVLLKSKVG